MFSPISSTETYVIAEVGQNHQGDFETALSFISKFAECGANAVKFQTRNNKYLFSEEAYNKSYNSSNAFSAVYGEHREFLELDPALLADLKAECDRHNVDFMSTPFDEPSIEVLLKVGVKSLKVASFDIGNLPLIDKMAKTKLPLVVSVGGGNFEQIAASVETVLAHHDDLAILHCVSEYPCPVEKLGLNAIPFLQEKFPNVTVGISDHFNGILSGPVAYMKGARVFEKHVTLDRSQKGTDHPFSLEPDGFRRFVRDIRRVPEMMEPKNDGTLGNEPVFQKLGKSLVLNKPLTEKEIITIDDLSGRIFNENVIPVRQANEVIGKRLKHALPAWTPISFDDLV